ncbi:UNVERIFIED_CONTAM: hypothetical protein OHV15_05885 [Microbacterium sp. SLM126]
MLTFEPTVTLIATIVLPCAAIFLVAAALIGAVRRRTRRAAVLALITSICVLGTFVAATIVAHTDGLTPPG